LILSSHCVMNQSAACSYRCGSGSRTSDTSWEGPSGSMDPIDQYLICSNHQFDLEVYATSIYLTDRTRSWHLHDKARYHYTRQTCIYQRRTVATCTMTSRLASDYYQDDLDRHVTLLEARQNCVWLTNNLQGDFTYYKSRWGNAIQQGLTS
jgi:hypothetical protein